MINGVIAVSNVNKAYIKIITAKEEYSPKLLCLVFFLILSKTPPPFQ
jgi:hypothetical protein